MGSRADVTAEALGCPVSVIVRDMRSSYSTQRAPFLSYWLRMGIAGLLFAVSFPGDSRGDRAVEVYLPKHRTALDLLPVANAALEGEGKATLDAGSNALVLVGTTAAVAQAREILNGRDVRRAMIAIRYEVRDSQDFQSMGIAIDWNSEAAFGVGRVRYTGRSSDGRVYGTRRESRSSGEIRVMDGAEGYVGEGRAVPLTRRDRYGAGTVAMVHADSGFTARPQILGDGRIQLDLSRVTATVDERGAIDYAESMTTVIVTPGETVAIAGWSGERQRASGPGKTLSTRSLRDRQENAVYLLTPVIQPH